MHSEQSGLRVRNTLALSFSWLTLTMLGACSAAGDSDRDADAGDRVAAVPVEVAGPMRGDIYSTYTGTAPIEAFADATVIAKVGGEVVEIRVEEGDDVDAGQVLARLDGERLRLELAEIDARLQKLKQDYSRNVRLREKNLISEGDFETILYDTEALEAAHGLAELELGYTEIRAPIGGVISERFIKAGNTIDANSPAFQVTSLEPLVAYLHVPEREYRRMRSGLTASVTVDALPGLTFAGAIERTSPVVDPATGTFKLTIEVSDPSRRLKPGMFGRISIVSDRRENALQIPRNAIVEQAGRPYVFVVEDGIAERRAIETGYVDGAWIEVNAGIADGDRVVVVGQSNLKDRASVSIVGGAPPARTRPDDGNPGAAHR